MHLMVLLRVFSWKILCILWHNEALKNLFLYCCSCVLQLSDIIKSYSSEVMEHACRNSSANFKDL